MKKLRKKSIITIISISLALLLIIGVGMWFLLKKPGSNVVPDPYVIPTEFFTNYTVEEHKERIYQRATEIAESIAYEGEIKYDVVYDELDQPRFFVVEFEEVVSIYVGKEKRDFVEEFGQDQYVDTRMLYGAIVDDEYYIMSYGLLTEMETAYPLSKYSDWEKQEMIQSTPSSIYTLLDVWDYKKYYLSYIYLYEIDGIIYRGKHKMVEEKIIHTETISGSHHQSNETKNYYARKYEAESTVWCMAEEHLLDNSGSDFHWTLELNPAFAGNRMSICATSLDQAYVFKAYER